MKVYILDTKNPGLVSDLCKSQGVQPVAPMALPQEMTMPADDELFIDQVDALILEATHPSRDTHFLLAQAVLAGKPTLCLYAKNQPPRELLRYLHKNNSANKVKTFSYTKKTLDDSVVQFLQRHNPANVEGYDTPSIKYTLRLTPRIEEYLDWKANASGTTKAKLIRHLLAAEAYDSSFRDRETPHADILPQAPAVDGSVPKK